MKSILIKSLDLLITPLVILNGDRSISTLTTNPLELLILNLIDLRDYLVTGY